jgi:outer membrane lipoprotein SlyB
VVLLIESVPKQAGSAAGAAAAGAVGSSGAAGTSSMEVQSYRVTLRMDDGTTRVITQDKAPNFRSGDRVNMQDGMIIMTQ